MNTATRVRLARKRADRLNLKLIKNGHHFRLRDADEITLAVGHLGVVEAFLAAAKSQNSRPVRRRASTPRHPGGATSTTTCST